MKRIAVAALLLSGVLHGQGTEMSCPTMVDAVFDLTGLNDTIAALPVQIQTVFEAAATHDTRISAAERQRVVSIIRSAFSAAKVSRDVKQKFLSPCDPEMLQTVGYYMQGALGTKMTKEEAFAQTPQGTRQMAAYSASLGQHPPAKARVELIQRLAAATGSTEFGVEIGVASLRGLGLLPPSAEAALRAQIEKSFESTSFLCALYTYRNVTNAELAEYLSFYEMPAFQKFTATMKAAFLQVIERQAQAAGAQVRSHG